MTPSGGAEPCSQQIWQAAHAFGHLPTPTYLPAYSRPTSPLLVYKNVMHAKMRTAAMVHRTHRPKLQMHHSYLVTQHLLATGNAARMARAHPCAPTASSHWLEGKER